MKTLKILAVLVTLSICAVSLSYGQSKKALREENNELKAENHRLNQETTQLESQNQGLIQENKMILDQNATMRSQVTQLQRDYDGLNKQHLALQSDYDALKGNVGTPSSGGSGLPPVIGSGSSPYGDPNDTRKCAYYQNRLTPGQTYTELFNPLDSEGWGVQVYSSKSLCQASEEAERFKSKYTLYKTYIRCKEVNGQYVYAVVYGTLKDKAQASTYLKNFKRVAGSKYGASAFLVQH